MNQTKKDVLDMLKQAKDIAEKSVCAFNQLKLHPGSAHEGIAELLRAQAQNAYAMILLSSTIWTNIPEEGESHEA